LRPGRVYPVRQAHPVPFDATELEKLARRLAKTLAPGAYAVGSHYACRALGLARSNVVTPRLYLTGDVAELLASVGLAASAAGDAAFDVVMPRAEKSVLWCVQARAHPRALGRQGRRAHRRCHC
jgi:hypothetical protein